MELPEKSAPRDEEKIKGLQREIAELQARLQETQKELDAFSYSVSHDLRAPIRAIDGFSRILNEDFAAELSPEARRFLGFIVDNSETLGRLIEDLLAYYRLSKHRLLLERVDVKSIVRQTFEQLLKEEPDRPVKTIIGDFPSIHSDRNLLHQIFQQLLQNALKFTRPKPESCIEVGSQTKGSDVILYVRDNGIGFDMQYAPKLFEVFQRLNRPEEFEGNGIGLAMVRKLARLLGGQVWAEGQKGESATFYVSLPQSQKR